MKARIDIRKLSKTGYWHYKITFFQGGYPNQVLSNDIGKGYVNWVTCGRATIKACESLGVTLKQVTFVRAKK